MENIIIFGDSYSTYLGYNPEGYDIYYPRENGQHGVDSVDKTWWKMLANEKDYKIVLNNSWSGSTMCNTGYNGDCSKTSSFIHRLEELIEKGFFRNNKIDRVFVFGATNDDWTGNPCGEQKLSGWSRQDLFVALPGIAYFLYKLKSVLGKDKIHFIINSDLGEKLEKGIKEICEHYGISYTLLQNIEKLEAHPTFNGMQQIKEQVMKNL